MGVDRGEGKIRLNSAIDEGLSRRCKLLCYSSTINRSTLMYNQRSS